MSEDVTPIRQQYLDIKKRYPEAILFFRLGDFYETFDRDAEITARELDIVLTSRNVAKGIRIPMAGIPHHAVDNYLSRLIEKGYHVAICEQVGEQPVKGLFPREVVRVVTPGTVLEPSLLPGERNNYLLAIFIMDRQAGLAYTDISTGEFYATAFEGDEVLAEIRAEIARLRPSEILLPEGAGLGENGDYHYTHIPTWQFEPGRCKDTLLRHFNASTLEGFGLNSASPALRPAGVILQYLQSTQPAAVKLLTNLRVYATGEYMTLDSSTRKNLELTETIRSGQVEGSLLSVLDYTRTPMGKRLIKQWIARPLLNLEQIEARLDAVALFTSQGLQRAAFRQSIGGLSDMERLINRVVSGHANPRDLTALRESLAALPEVLGALAELPDLAAEWVGKVTPCESELILLQQAIAENPPATLSNTGVINPGFSTELDQIIQTSRHAREWIAGLEAVERERTGIKTLKVGYNKVFGYFLEITHSNTEAVPADYIRKQTLVNAERYITPEMKEYEAIVLNAEERIHEVERRVFKDVCEQLSQSYGKIMNTSQALAALDVLAAFGEAAAISNYTRPAMRADAVLNIINGRHPVVEALLASRRFVANDTTFKQGQSVWVITGPNMSGKSTFLRQVALIVLMAQIGSFVPAESAEIGLTDRIFTRIGAQDEIHAGQSTFMVEMVETANILRHATPSSLLILDEIGRGTSTYDGLSIAWAIVEYLHNHPNLRARTLFATHFHELIQLASFLPGVANYNVSVAEVDNQVVFLHKIIPGGADRSYGIHVAQLAGIPQQVIQRAGEILRQLETSSGTAVEINPNLAQQMELFPQTNPLLDELRELDINTLSPIEAINKLYEWRSRYIGKPEDK